MSNSYFIKACAYAVPLIPKLKEKIKNKRVYQILCVLVVPIGCLKWLGGGYKCVPKCHELAIVAIAKNEGDYIEEWLKFYINIGVKHLIIFDNESDDGTSEILKEYAAKGYVDYYYFKGKSRQLDAYNIALEKYRSIYKYMAFIDCDEFLYSDNDLEGTIKSIFNKFQKKKIGAIGVNWLIFGSSGYKCKPDGAVLECYLRRSDEMFEANRHIKTICDPTKILAFANPHSPVLVKGYKQINEKGDILTGPCAKTVSCEKLRINHYFTKSKEEFIKKRNRGKADSAGIRRIEEFDERDRNEVFDDRILKKLGK